MAIVLPMGVLSERLKWTLSKIDSGNLSVGWISDEQFYFSTPSTTEPAMTTAMTTTLATSSKKQVMWLTRSLTSMMYHVWLTKYRLKGSQNFNKGCTKILVKSAVFQNSWRSCQIVGLLLILKNLVTLVVYLLACQFVVCQNLPKFVI